MATKIQLFSTIAMGAAFVAAHLLMPETASAWWDRPRRTAPEVDPGTISSALALAMGGLAVLSDKLRRK